MQGNKKNKTKKGPNNKLVSQLNEIIATELPNVQILKLLGKGDNASVYSIENDIDKVLKVIEIDTKDTCIEDTTREIEMCKELNKIDIGPQIYSHVYIKSHKMVVLILERLKPMNRSHGDFTVSRQKELIDKVAKMVDHGYIHNDLHLGNVMINATGKITVIDFGFTVKMEHRPRDELVFNQIVISQLYSILDPCNFNNCFGSSKSERWPDCALSKGHLNTFCDSKESELVNEIYRLKRGESLLWKTVSRADTLNNMEYKELRRLAQKYGIARGKTTYLRDELSKKFNR